MSTPKSPSSNYDGPRIDPRKASKQAVIHGDFHLSEVDQEDLLNRDLSEWDALLIEGRRPNFDFEDASFGFGYYAIGAIFIRTCVKWIHGLKRRLGLSKRTRIDRLRDRSGFDVFSNIDASHKEIWDFSDSKWKWTLITLAAALSIVLIIDSTIPIIPILVGINVPELYSIVLIFPFLPGAVHILSVVSPTNSSKRNEVMADNIIEYVEDKDHDRVLILVGEMHREGVTNRLSKNANWDVRSIESKHSLGKVFTSFYEIRGDWT